MSENIEREKVLKLINSRKRNDAASNILDYSAEWNEALEQLESDIEDMPAADVTPVVHGRWIFGEFNGIGIPVWCSNCEERTSNIADLNMWLTHPKHKYCGRCGAKMDMKEEK